MERSFRKKGASIERRPSPQAWQKLEHRLGHRPSSRGVRSINPVWLAAACLLLAVLSLPYLMNSAQEHNDITALHPGFTVEEVKIETHSNDHQAIHNLDKAYRRLNLK